MLIFTKKLVKIGQSLGIIVDKPIRDKLRLRKGDYLLIDINKVDK